MKRIITTIISLMVAFALRSQSPYNCRYWFGNEDEATVVALTEGSQQVQFDVGALREGPHFLYLQFADASMSWSPVKAYFFMKAAAEVEVPVSQTVYRCWFDQDIEHQQTGTLGNGNFLLDVSDLSEGLHFVHIQFEGDAFSSTRSYLFMKMTPPEPAGEWQYHCWFDQNSEVVQSGLVGDGNFFLDVNGLSVGQHMMTMQLDNGTLTPAQDYIFYRIATNTYTVTVAANPPEGGEVSYEIDGSVCTLTAIANSGYTFIAWTKDGATVSTDAIFSFTLTQSGAYVANFQEEVNSYDITVTAIPEDGGTIIGAGIYQEGDICTLTTTANDDYTFTNWTENGVVVSTDATYSFIVTGSRTLVANFASQGDVPIGAVNGLFSVSEGSQVYFSQGNLQYIGSAVEPYWKFAENQWDCFGESQNGESQTLDRDLFSWGTSGYNHGAVCYQPWSTNTDDSNYYVYGSPEYNLDDQTGLADWGYNAIANGGNTHGSWRTLVSDEWVYVFNNRNTVSGIRFAKAIVNGVNGVVLLPDNWVSSTYPLNNTNSGSAHYDSNTISASDWMNMLEVHGAVFLPAAGDRWGTSVVEAGTGGFYWSATQRYDSQAYDISFRVNEMCSYGYCGYYRNCGRSVRLVHTDGNVTSYYGIEATPNPAEGGTVTGAGIYQEGDTCTLTATPNEDYTFTNWTENGEVVSTDAVYSFIVTGSRSLVAHFTANPVYYTITTTINPEEGGMVTGGGTYSEGDTCTLTATANEGYSFVNWMENGIIVSTDAVYSFAVTGSKNFVANFYHQVAGVINGLFSISETQKVKFSQGNLQYQASSNTWRFAEHQWDYVGTQAPLAGCIGGGTVAGGDNHNISPTYNGWIDLFGWGTSGYNHGAVCFQPWSISESSSDYYPYGCDTCNLYDNTGQADWGYNPIVNGGNVENCGWRTLTDDEWACVLHSRNTVSGIRWTKGTVNGVCGVVLLPDNWVTSIYQLNSPNGGDYDSNVITAEDWTNTLETNGAVFLPAAGCRIGKGVAYTGGGCQDIFNGSQGHYWTSSRGFFVSVVGNAENRPFAVVFACSTTITNHVYGLHYAGRSVRLVRSVEGAISYEINATPNPAESGTIIGAGIYQEGDTCTLTATANDGYVFTNWTENNEVVSSDAVYSFIVTGSRSLVANFTANPVYYTITTTINPEEGGMVTGGGTYSEGDTCTLTATANEGYSFANWMENGIIVSTDAVYSFAVTGNASYVAHFTAMSSSNLWVIAEHYPDANDPNSPYARVYWAEPSNGFYYDFEDYLIPAGWTTIDADGDGYNWIINSTVIPGNYGHNNSYGLVISQSYINNVGTLFPDNYLVSEPVTITNGSHFSFWACAQDASYSAEHFGVFVSLGSNTNPNDFQCVHEWTTTAKDSGGRIMDGEASRVGETRSQGLWYHYDVDLSAYAGIGYIAIRHFNCSDQFYLDVDDVQFTSSKSEGSVFNLYRAYCDGSNATLIAQNVADNQYIDYEWANLPSGNYKYGVIDVESSNADISWSNCLEKLPIVGTTQTSTFAQGWNWWSTYVDANDLLEQLENGLGTHGQTIKSQSGFVQYLSDYNLWYGSTGFAVNNESFYMVQTDADCDVEISGSQANPEEHPITVAPGWNWIGYPCDTHKNFNNAFAGITPQDGDVVKSQAHGFASYMADYGIWYGNLNDYGIDPGMGLMYKSNNNQSFSFTYPQGRGKEPVGNDFVENNYWNANYNAYANNMTVTAIVELDDVEVNSENYEFAAFANGECRGSVRLMHVAPLNRYMAFLTVAGEEASELSFSLYDVETGTVETECLATLQYETNATIGSFESPYVVRFRSTTGVDELGSRISVFPNPVARGEKVNIDLTASNLGKMRVEIVNALGEVVETVQSSSVQTITAPEMAGVYTLRIIVEGKGAYFRKLVVR